LSTRRFSVSPCVNGFILQKDDSKRYIFKTIEEITCILNHY
jgi:hypothetical protein